MKKFLLRGVLVAAFATFGFSACGEEPSFSKETLAAADKLAKTKKSSVRSPFGQNEDEYVLTFADEFDSFNRKLWNDHIWYERPNPTKNYTVEDGKLKIWPQRDASGKFFNRTIDTDGKFEQRYGFFEIEAKLTKGKGTWPAFWLFAHPDKRRPEIDVMEAYPGGEAPWGYTDADGVSRPTAYGATVWYDEGVKAGEYKHNVGKDLSARFHRYAVKWEPDRQTFYFDGKPVHTVEARMTDSMYIMLDLWFGSSSGDPDASTPQGKSNSFEINYVRAWQMKRFINQ
ncbi:glycoside hydrolase family 16 protein [Noviherbaspirillum aerium]|uniref:glycoside hydrolase family 16 protein n=1 Tax=Noviherbaspirillum aerium TaxID=2588497 RepID=UPI001CEF5942|nr:glycoside hydrolase family 16 protein [Noviherbaspirillum aerium]